MRSFSTVPTEVQADQWDGIQTYDGRIGSIAKRSNRELGDYYEGEVLQAYPGLGFAVVGAVRTGDWIVLRHPKGNLEVFTDEAFKLAFTEMLPNNSTDWYLGKR